MDSKAVKFQIPNGSIARLVLFRVFLAASAISLVSLLHILSGFDFGWLASVTPDDCKADLGSANDNMTAGSYLFHSRFVNPFWGSFDSPRCKEDAKLTISVVTELMGKQFLDCGAKALCVGEGSALAVSAMQQLGFSSVSGVNKHRLFSLKQKHFAYELDYQDCSFDFVFSRDLDKVSVPALLVLDVERILKPGGIGAMLVGISGSSPDNLIRSVAPVSSLLRSSGVVHVRYMNDLNLVVFKKQPENASPFQQFRLPSDCPSLAVTKPLIEQMEPLVVEKPIEFEKKISYLPKFMDNSTMKRLVYVDIGAGGLPNSNVTSWFLPSYPIDRKAFNVYFVDYNTSILLSYVKQPGVTFVYHPGLVGKKVPVPNNTEGDLDPSLEDEEFNFLAWFKETVQYADFVVLKMNSGTVELKFISDLFESGAICFVDELFLHCSGSAGDEGVVRGGCMDLFKGLRRNGVFVHQWWGD
ncbi:Methyltransferase type [Quillaja saponaria]|uniref:Methyltransferase type n=1 Tax=Quillaja saponaria TaxID=32244 RepID=A0AAD7Q8N8_QUISA|nr:Methyltransferase type [Quillaja saponaria]